MQALKKLAENVKRLQEINDLNQELSKSLQYVQFSLNAHSGDVAITYDRTGSTPRAYIRPEGVAYADALAESPSPFVPFKHSRLPCVSHNVANDTQASPGKPLFWCKPGYPVPMLAAASNGQYGTGVQVSQVMRAQDHFVETRISGEPVLWETLQEGLSR